MNFISVQTKMYWQILAAESDRDLQRILWKINPFPAKIFRLRTTTYGTSCAPVFATRTLKTLAEEVKRVSSRSSGDDILTGSDSLETTKSLQLELLHLLDREGMKLH